VRFLGEGVVGTITATALGAVISFPLGAVLALGRLSKRRILRTPAAGYVELSRCCC
jgi:glutamate transport system permease protein